MTLLCGQKSRPGNGGSFGGGGGFFGAGGVSSVIFIRASSRSQFMRMRMYGLSHSAASGTPEPSRRSDALPSPRRASSKKSVHDRALAGRQVAAIEIDQPQPAVGVEDVDMRFTPPRVTGAEPEEAALPGVDFGLLGRPNADQRRVCKRAPRRAPRARRSRPSGRNRGCRSGRICGRGSLSIS